MHFMYESNPSRVNAFQANPRAFESNSSKCMGVENAVNCPAIVKEAVGNALNSSL
jgi:hypothetical protein